MTLVLTLDSDLAISGCWNRNAEILTQLSWDPELTFQRQCTSGAVSG